MSLEQEFIPGQVIAELCQEFEARMQAKNIPADEIARLMHFLGKMAEVASQLILSEKAITVPNTEQSVPFDKVTAHQTMQLFCEGLYYSQVKCWEMGIPADLEAQFLQNVAQWVYDNAKQVVLSTYGQEHTPQYQISEEQQVQMVNQTSESALLYYISEYEKANGPIPTEHRAPEEPPEPVADTPAALPGGEEESSEQPVAVLGPNTNDKFAALALLLNTLPERQKHAVLAGLSDEERELVHYYSNPDHIEADLDIGSVIEHLRHLKETVLSGKGGQQKSTASRAIEEMALRYPKEVLLSYVRNERPAVQNYLEAFFRLTPSPEENIDPFLAWTAGESGSRPRQLPPKIEAALYRYLSRRVS